MTAEWALVNIVGIVSYSGIMTALIACFIDIVIDQISIQKYSYLKEGKKLILKKKNNIRLWKK